MDWQQAMRTHPVWLMNHALILYMLPTICCDVGGWGLAPLGLYQCTSSSTSAFGGMSPRESLAASSVSH